MEPTASKPSPFRAEQKLSCSSFPVALLNKFGWRSCLNCANDRAVPDSLRKIDNRRCERSHEKKLIKINCDFDDPPPDGSGDQAAAIFHPTRRICPPCTPMDSSFVAAKPTGRSCTPSESSVVPDTITERNVASSEKESVPIGTIVSYTESIRQKSSKKWWDEHNNTVKRLKIKNAEFQDN
jgi:hypothetical protein